METAHGRDDVRKAGARMWAAALASAARRRGGGAESEAGGGGGGGRARDEEKMASRDRVAQAKSRAERSRPPTVPIPQVEIIPGRLSEGDWLALLSFEEAEDSVGDILAGMLDQVMEDCYKVYLARQCIPYVINQAREAMLQIIEWRFLVRDKGETDVPTDPAWQEDEEPVACITDSWAQGSVPVMQATAGPREVLLVRLPEEAASVKEEGPSREDEVAASGPRGHPWKEEQEARKETKEAGGPLRSMLEVPPAKSHSSKVRLSYQEELPAVKADRAAPSRLSSFAKQSFSHQGGSDGHLRAARFSRPLVALEGSEKDLLLQRLSRVLVEEEEESVGRPLLLPPSCSNLLRIQLGRPPNTRAVFYDERGRIALVPHLDPARLPKHRIRPSVEVIDPDVESRRQEALKTVAGRCTQQLRSRRQLSKTLRRSTAAGPGGIQPLGTPQLLLRDWRPRATQGQLVEQATHSSPPPGRVLEPTTLVFVKPTLLVETVDLAPGVSLRYGDSANWRLPPMAPQEADTGRAHGELRPLCPRVPFPMGSLSQKQEAPRPLPRLHPGAAPQSGCPC